MVKPAPGPPAPSTHIEGPQQNFDFRGLFMRNEQMQPFCEWVKLRSFLSCFLMSRFEPNSVPDLASSAVLFLFEFFPHKVRAETTHANRLLSPLFNPRAIALIQFPGGFSECWAYFALFLDKLGQDVSSDLMYSAVSVCTMEGSSNPCSR
jgi:hypothetical protein